MAGYWRPGDGIGATMRRHFGPGRVSLPWAANLPRPVRTDPGVCRTGDKSIHARTS